MTVENWFDEYVDAIYNYIFLIVKDKHLAEELTQETFYKAVLKEEQFKGESSAKTWLFRIAYTSTMSHFRKNKPLVTFFNLKDKVTEIPEDIMIRNEQVKYLYGVLFKLKPTYQQVIILREIKGFSTKETADILHWSEGKVKMQLSRALNTMRKILEESGYDYETFA